MTLPITFGPDPVQEELDRILRQLQDGEDPRERKHVDLKEEAGRRGPRGQIIAGRPDNVAAAEHLAGEAACMANTPGGGALVVGVAKDGTLIGAELDGEWLRHRIYELLGRLLTVTARAVFIKDVRLLVLVIPEAVEPIRWHGRINWRVDDHCVEVDAPTWHADRRMQFRFDWSAQPSGVTTDKVRGAAVDVARDLLRDRSDAASHDLAAADTPALLRRLNAVTGAGVLTNAAVLAFVGRDSASIDYIHRDFAGDDNTARVRRTGRSLLEDLQEVFTAARANNPIRHLRSGLVIGQERQIPERALREAVVNGMAHRDWFSDAPTLVEHTGGSIRVTSPGGFFGGVTPDNIITHPSESRNIALAELLTAVGVAERQGVGVDRMVGDMLRLGYPSPQIIEIEGPHVATSLVSRVVDLGWMAWLGSLGDEFRRDLRALMMLRRLLDAGWIDAPSIAPVLQVGLTEAVDAIEQLMHPAFGTGVIRPIDGVPDDAPHLAFVLTTAARSALEVADAQAGIQRPAVSREAVALGYARARGRISSTELAALVGAAPSNVGPVLRRLEEAGRLLPSREVRRGAGFYYLPAS